MDSPAEQRTSISDPRSPLPSRARRRLIQSTMLPLDNADQNINKPEVAVTKEETTSKGMDEEEDLHQLNNHTRSPQKRRRCSSATPEKRRSSATPAKRCTSATPKKRGARATPEKRQKNSTAKKKLLSSGLNDGSVQPNNPIPCERASQLVPDLRLEAKLQAEENLRIYGGRLIHPFFSSWKTVKRSQERTDEESDQSLVDKKGQSINFSPIHVFEQVEDDENLSLDWGNWTFSERSVCANFDLKSESSNYETTVKVLHFDNFLNASGCQNNGSSYKCLNKADKVPSHLSPIQQDYIHSASSVVFSDEQAADRERSIERVENYTSSEVNPSAVDATCAQISDVKYGDIFFKEKMISYGHSCVNQPQNSLWTNKYQPKKANEICGNGECVTYLNNWLRLWHEKSSGVNKIIGNIDSEQDAEYSRTSVSDSGDMDEENRLKNVLLITGPVGSGKSAAIYACAEEQGFQVIEVNASDWRNGALVKQRFREAVESHWLSCTTADQGINKEVTEMISLSDSEDSDYTRMTPAELVSKKSDKKTLILFEDVDTVFDEDRGFLGSIQQLAETAKRPMILTSNSNNPVLPNNLDRLKLCFNKPSLEELFCLASMVCSAEKVAISPCLVRRFIEFCHRDIRKTILHLQFWCQGQTYTREKKILGAYGLMVFDTDAGHNVLPKMISCDYPSQLSEIVDKVITKSVLEVKEATHLNLIDEEEPNIYNSGAIKFQPNSIDARKEAMLSCYCSDQDGNEFPSQLGTACELSNSSGSSVAFGQQGIPRRTETMLSSQSGEECSRSRGSFPFVPHKESKEEHLEAHLDVISKGPSHCFSLEMSNNAMTEQLLQAPKVFAPLNGTCRLVDVPCVRESSFVSDTDFFSGTLWGNVDNTAESSNTKNGLANNRIDLNMSPSKLDEIPIFTKTQSEVVTNSSREVEEIIDSRINGAETAVTNSEFPVVGIDLNLSLYGSDEIPVLLNNKSDTITILQPIQQVVDSHVECVQGVPREYHQIDECDSMNFSMRSRYKKNHSCLVASDTVQETWRRLRDSHINFQQYAILERKDASKVLKLAHGLSNLISEADMLLSDCQLLVSDYLEPSMVPCEDSHFLSWYDDHLKMVSIISEHGMCLYAKDIDAAGTNMFSTGRLDLAWEMLASSRSTMSLGKLVNRDSRRIQNSEMSLPDSGISTRRQSASSLSSIVQSLIPARSYLSVKGNALHEYLSSLSHISRLEDNRLLENHKSTTRRVCVGKNYLSNAAPSLTPRDISLLSQYSYYQKASHQFLDNIRGESFCQ
ncbi:uncharacterized protein LOC108223102 isoform X1 [Daucus carota subsp. sativus]|uniref:AAA+ ATPase domain-containing protein n=1 Tax=Daucus carota subsp. sativus TaxID=79200 RepID=A0A164Y9H9_DAUCS|nr:PREDICTED: uncharacterized protein LOC108223102 isoform X1 [Daucus carota subsp. sativus]